MEGVTEYLLLHALGEAFGWSLDKHGVSVIDFQQSGNPGVYATLAEAFGIPWQVIVDGDAEGLKYRQHILERGFTEEEVAARFVTLPQPNNLEAQLVADGHRPLLREIVSETAGNRALQCTDDEFASLLGDRKTCYMGGLCDRIVSDADLATSMPAPFVTLVTQLRDGQM